MKKNSFLKILLICFSIIAATAIIEAIGQIYALSHPSFEVLTLEPDPFIGWKHTPNLQWPWAGNYWYQRDFRVEIKNNSHGFRDSERKFEKSAAVRIALLGGSFIEALQVPLKKTVGSLLEKKLNAAGERDSKKYEVLNFGVSGHSIGQSLLTWEFYASKFSPDYAVIFVNRRTLEQTTIAEESGNFPETENLKLDIRPTFKVEGDKLIRIPARDYARFAAAQKELVRRDFGGLRVRKRRPGLFLAPYFNQIGIVFKTIKRAFIFKIKAFIGYKAQNNDAGRDKAVLNINLRVIQELRNKAAAAGATLILVDPTTHFDPDMGSLSGEIMKFCALNHIPYIALSPELDRANQQGRPTRWRHDAHFNEEGNRIFAETLYRWFKSQR